MQALSLKEVHEEEDEMDDAAEEAEELQAERIREAELLSRCHSHPNLHSHIGRRSWQTRPVLVLGGSVQGFV